MAKQVAKTKVKKKKWFPVIAPKMFRENVIGEIHLYESEAMLNRGLTVNMMNLTGNPRNQQINVLLRISSVREGKGHTEILGYEMMPSGVKRIVRRGRTKVDDSVIIATSDKKKVKIKPLIITNTSANKSVANSIRIDVRNHLAHFVAKLTYDNLVEEIMSFKLQKYLGNAASKIAPIRSSEIRAFRLVEREGVRVLKPGEIKEVIKEPKKEKPAEEQKEEKKAEKENKEEVKENKKEKVKKEEPVKEEKEKAEEQKEQAPPAPEEKD